MLPPPPPPPPPPLYPPPLLGGGGGAGGALASVDIDDPSSKLEARSALAFTRYVPACSIVPFTVSVAAAPAGIVLDSRESIVASLERTKAQLEARTMPIGNLTGMTDEERATVLAWIQHGAP